MLIGCYLMLVTIILSDKVKKSCIVCVLIGYVLEQGSWVVGCLSHPLQY